MYFRYYLKGVKIITIHSHRYWTRHFCLQINYVTDFRWPIRFLPHTWNWQYFQLHIPSFIIDHYAKYATVYPIYPFVRFTIIQFWRIWMRWVIVCRHAILTSLSLHITSEHIDVKVIILHTSSYNGEIMALDDYCHSVWRMYVCYKLCYKSMLITWHLMSEADTYTQSGWILFVYCSSVLYIIIWSSHWRAL